MEWSRTLSTARARQRNRQSTPASKHASLNGRRPPISIRCRFHGRLDFALPLIGWNGALNRAHVSEDPPMKDRSFLLQRAIARPADWQMRYPALTYATTNATADERAKEIVVAAADGERIRMVFFSSLG